MKTRTFALLASIVIVTLLIVAPTVPLAAHRPEAPGPGLRAGSHPPEVPADLWTEVADGPRGAPEGGRPPAQGPGLAPEDTGGPDNFGYTWDDSVSIDWIDATDGTDTGMSGGSGNQFAGPFPLPFPFRFYENIYTEVYVAASGYLAFSNQWYWPDQQDPMPSARTPNDVIAPFWTIMHLASTGPGGRIYYKSGGTSPDRFFVVEWHDVAGGTASDPSGGDETYRFQVILYENGDIVCQYHTMIYNDWRYYASIGIEDSLGLDGLGYMDFGNYWSRVPASGKAIRFYRPAPQARVKSWPPYHGSFAPVGGSASFQVPIQNIGELGADVFDVTSSSIWPLALYASDGVTPLTDTDSDGTPDTGPVAQGDTTTVVAKVDAPASANVGDSGIATLTPRSSLDTDKSSTVTLKTALPAPFAQVYRDTGEATMSLYLARPSAQVEKEASPDGHYGYDTAVAETSGGFVYLWRRYREEGSVWVHEIEYTLLDSQGDTLRAVDRLTDHTGATVNSQDTDLAVDVAPDGRIGVLWERYLWDSGTDQSNSNIFFAVLNASGSLVYGPLNLTNNSAWGSWGDYDVPQFYAPHIAATDDDRFVLAWERYVETAEGTLEDVYYAVRATSGAEIKAVTAYTADTPGWDEGFYSPNVAPLSGSQVLLLWSQNSDGDVHYVVLDSDGDTVKAAANLSTGLTGWSYEPDAAQLADGRTVVAWSSGPGPDYPIAFAVLDTAYSRMAGPTALHNPAALTGNRYPSVARASTQAVLTWLDRASYDRRNLYYALVDSSGNVLTDPMIFRTSGASPSNIVTSYTGYGNTSYSLGAPIQVFLPIVFRDHGP